jgi:predicted transcriptional regulator
MATSRELTTKRKMLDVIQRMPKDATIDDAIERLSLLKAVAAGLREIEEGKVYDHDEVFDELLSDDPNQVERPGKIRPPGTQAANRKGHPARGPRLPEG